MADSGILARKYDCRRRLRHFQNPGAALFVTFCKLIREPFSEAARDVILGHCIHDHGRRFDLHAAVVMPDHVHLLLTPLSDNKGWPYPLSAILKSIKGTSARSETETAAYGDCRRIMMAVFVARCRDLRY
jgi:REP element-mobilizing transposase RayT